jgi:hypothetical protein
VVDDYEKIFDVSGLRRFIRFHEYFDLFKQLFKPNLSRFFVKKIDEFLEILIDQSTIEAERFDQEEIQPGETKNYTKLMPFVTVYIETLTKSIIKKIDDQQ